MLKIKLTAGSLFISESEEQAVEQLKHILPDEEGYIIPIMFVGKQTFNREIDALLLLSDMIFLIDFKDWRGERIEVEGINGKVKQLLRGAWEERGNSFPNYEYAARAIASKLMLEKGWLSVPPHIYSVMVFTGNAPVSFVGGDPNNPQPRNGVGVCRIEQFPHLLAAFRSASHTLTQLDKDQRSTLANILLAEVKTAPQHRLKRIEGYRFGAEHHTDTFLNCKIYTAKGETFDDPVWIKEYEQVLATPKQRNKREQLVLRHADVLLRFPQHPNIVPYRQHKATTSHLYVILLRQPGAFLSELISQKPFGLTTQANLALIPFDMSTRLHILGDLLNALEYLMQQLGFERSAYRDLRPDSIFVRTGDTTPVAQLFNFDCTKLPGSVTKLGHLKEGLKRSSTWDDYASPELLEYIEADHTTSSVGFTGDVSSDLFSWGTIAWELLTGELPFPNSEVKLRESRRPWPTQLAVQGDVLTSEAIELIAACLEYLPTSRPSLTTLKQYFP